MTAHDTAPIILWRTALGGTAATAAPTTAHDTYTYATLACPQWGTQQTPTDGR